MPLHSPCDVDGIDVSLHHHTCSAVLGCPSVSMIRPQPSVEQSLTMFLRPLLPNGLVLAMLDLAHRERK